MAMEYSCAIAASRLGYDLKKTIEYAKKQDFTGTLTGLVTITQNTGALEACGLKLDKTPLINALMALCPKDWDAVEERLRAFGEHAYQKVMGP